MPSFFETVKLIIQGKPVYSTSDQPQPQSTTLGNPTPNLPGEAPQSTIQKNNAGTFPVVHIERTESRHSGQTMEVYCSIRNAWNEEVILDSIRLLGSTRKFNIELRAGDEREELVYSGPALERQGGSEALLDYKTKTGDYFEAIHEVRYRYTSEKTYEVEELRFHPPIRDIYG